LADHVRGLDYWNPPAGPPAFSYSYIIDREQYADGSFGEPMMIVPTRRTRGAATIACRCKLIDIPAQKINTSYVTAQPREIAAKKKSNRRSLTIIRITGLCSAPSAISL